MSFRGGEPLLNFKVIRKMVEYAEEIKGTKIIHYTIVSNLIALNETIIDFFCKYGFQVSTSLDGPKDVHDNNRRHQGPLGSFEHVLRGIGKLQERGVCAGAIQTTTRRSLTKPLEIVRTYQALGLDGIFIRPLTPLGCAKDHWGEIGYTPQEYLDFYRKALEYIIELNKQGTYFRESYASILLCKILRHQSENYMELRSPCGAGVGQLAYNYDGNVYTCDEGRMVAEAGDKAFCLGNVSENDYNDLMNSQVCKTTVLSSITESIPGCSDCVYQPYCGICPVVSYAMEHNIFPKAPKGYKCQINAGIMDILFEMICSDDENLIVFNKGLE